MAEKSRCPFARWTGKSSAGAQDSPVSTEGTQFRPQSSREGIGPLKYLSWNMFYWVLETFNRGLARDPYRKVSWDKWPPFLGLLYLLAKIRFNRSNALTDPYDYATNDTKTFGREPEAAKHGYSADGTWVSDNDDPQMGATMTRFGSNIPPKKVRPDVENFTPSARSVGKLRWRRIDPETGEEKVVPAGILNDLAGGWIQFQFHNFGGNTLRDPVGQCPHMIKRDPKENWPGDVAIIDRTTKDPTRVTDNGRPTVLSERDMAWIQSQMYGTTPEEQRRVRSFEGGKLKVQSDGKLPEDPRHPGIDLAGFNNNFNPLLSLLHWMFVSEHNAITDHLAYFHPDWDEQTLFQAARETNCGTIARIHTVEWTEDLLQHPTLQIGMHADWYGFLGQRRKMALMRFFHRHPRISRMFTWVRNSELLWGMPGSKWEHHDGPFQVPKHFRFVYRLHEMILGVHEIVDPKTDRTLDRIDLLNFIHENTRPVVEKYGYETLAWSFVRKSCGALTLHNFPRALTQFKNQLDGTLTDLAERDTFRELTDGTGTYNEFRKSLGEPPVTSFLELTGGDVEMAKEVEAKFDGDIDAVYAGIGILVEPKPAGFALGFTQFYQFVLNAPRRVKSNRMLTEGFTYNEYHEGMDWIEHGGGILGAFRRHLPGLTPLLEGVVRGFAPWKETETFPLRMLEDTHADTGLLFKTDLTTTIFAAVACGAAAFTGVFSLTTALILVGLLSFGTVSLVVKRMLAMRFMQQVWQKCYTDKRGAMFGRLYKGERWINFAAHSGRLGSLAIMIAGAAVAWGVRASHPLVAVLMALVAIRGVITYGRSNKFAADAQLLKVSLRNRLRDGQPTVDSASLPGETALTKRYMFLADNNETAVATFGSCYRALKRSGLPWWLALGTSAASVIGFGPKTQRGMTRQQKREAGIGLLGWFKIYLPNLHQAASILDSRVYAVAGNTKGITPGDIDMGEFELMFRRYAPGRDYLTAYDFARMQEGDRVRNAKEGNGNFVTRFIAELSAGRRHRQLLLLFADRVAEQDHKLVPAISKDLMLRFYQGAAQYDLLREHAEGDTNPSPMPVRSLANLSRLNSRQLETVYKTSQAVELPNGESNGKALIMAGTFAGKILSAFANLLWKGKVVDRSKGTLVNKILGLRFVKAQVFPGRSWSDGGDSIIVDYLRTSLLAFFCRDEVRRVLPDLYLGKAYIRLPFGHRFCACYFALDFRV